MTAFGDRIFREALRTNAVSATAHTFRRVWNTASRPALVACDDGQEYVVKGCQVGRAIVNDQLVARLGAAIGAPVGHAHVVHMPAELVKLESELWHFASGPCHACRWIPGCTERASFSHYDISENRRRFASLAVLYGWVGANDHQFIYENGAPQLVWSVDHGHFFPGGPTWTMASLAAAPEVEPDAQIVKHCSITTEELAEPLARLAQVSNQSLADIIGAVPVQWEFSFEERVAVAEYLSTRRDRVAGLARSVRRASNE